jgi:hypothetical protein
VNKIIGILFVLTGLSLVAQWDAIHRLDLRVARLEAQLRAGK